MRSLEPPASTPRDTAPPNRPPRATSSALNPRGARPTEAPRTSAKPKPPPPGPTPLPSRAAPTLRPPLRARPSNNQNVLSLTAAKATRSTTTTASAAAANPRVSFRASNMPVGDRPRQPQLSAAAARAANRAPLTPKVAANKSPPVVSPLGRRTQNPTATVSAAVSQGHKDDAAATPLAAHLTANITPRSGTRQNRVDSANSTPSGTPVQERAAETWDNGRAMPAISYDTTKHSPQGDSAEDSAESKFFYASDARSHQPSPQGRPASVPQKPASFFYANGTAESKRTTSPPSSTPFTPVLGSTPEPAASKFFYANGSRDLAPARPSLPPSNSASTVSSSSKMASTRPGTSGSAVAHSPSMNSRPVSPTKVTSPPAPQGLKNSAMPPAPLNRPPTSAPATNLNGQRRVSIDTAPKIMTGHGRTGSVSTIEAFGVPRVASPSQTSEQSSPPVSPGPAQPAMTMASLLQAVEDLGDDDEAKDGDAQAEPQSPTKSVHGADAISELVANARRERKVQDLEITNASLEAINRTLERQLRKQTAELRRYRRLSRSGRLSIASAASSRQTSAAHTEAPTDLSALNEQEEESEEEEEEELDSLDDTESSSAGSASASDPLSPSTKLTKRRQRDERRLQLDLTKHQELLVDSQKINQSLKRCLNWTEVLIKEGHKALQYNVRVSDVELGGRVLAPPDEDDYPISAQHSGDEASGAAETGLEPPEIKGAQDRDSGVELPVDSG